MRRCASQLFVGCLLGLALTLLVPVLGAALEPEEILVVANAREPASLKLAEYYMEKRRIPRDHLIRLRCPSQERCSRQVYDQTIRLPIRRALEQRTDKERIRCLVMLYGTPLAILPPSAPVTDQAAPTPAEAPGNLAKPVTGRLDRVDPPRRLKEPKGRPARKVKNAADQSVAPAEPPRRALPISAEASQLWRQIGQLSARMHMDARAAVDSELMLVLVDDYPLDGWIPNPYFLGFRNQPILIGRDNVLIVSRLDGPDPATVKRLIDDTLHAEAQGLRGQACFDARWPPPGEQKNLRGYGLYDNSIHRAAAVVQASDRMPVRLDQEEGLFTAGSCPETALYCGWYSLGRYVDAFTWTRGAIGYHIASSECTTLKQRGSQVWCKRMLEEGVAATVGPVNEPYVESFPLPELFFAKLTEGHLGLGESYLVSLPYLSWQMVLIGDPMYQPFSPK